MCSSFFCWEPFALNSSSNYGQSSKNSKSKRRKMYKLWFPLKRSKNTHSCPTNSQANIKPSFKNKLNMNQDTTGSTSQLSSSSSLPSNSVRFWLKAKLFILPSAQSGTSLELVSSPSSTQPLSSESTALPRRKWTTTNKSATTTNTPLKRSNFTEPSALDPSWEASTGALSPSATAHLSFSPWYFLELSR